MARPVQSVGVLRLSGGAHDGFHFEEFLEAMLAPFAAITGLLIATERCREVWALAVDLDLASADAIGDLRGFGRLTLDIASETVFGVIRHFDRFVHAVIRDHDEDRAEDFFARNGHVIGDVGEHGGTREVAAIEPFGAACTTGDQRRIKRWEHEAVLETVEQRLAAHPEMMSLRRQTVEHPFGTLKFWMGAVHFLTRRLKGVRTEMSLHVLAYNLKRVINIVGTTVLIEAIRA